jgi:hypothetical protein
MMTTKETNGSGSGPGGEPMVPPGLVIPLGKVMYRLLVQPGQPDAEIRRYLEADRLACGYRKPS